MPRIRFPRRGSMQVWPRVRAKREYARVRSWPEASSASVLGFAGYKAGMTHIAYVDNRKFTPTKNEEISSPVTVVECPPLKVSGIRFYGKSQRYGVGCLGEVSAKADKELARRANVAKKPSEDKLKHFESKLGEITNITLLVHTQPKLTGVGKKMPEVFELGIGGNVQQKLDTAKSFLGKELRVSEVFKEGQQIDVQAITKGKGTQGPVKRFGVDLRQHKAEKTKRGPATLGPWHPHHGNYRVAHAGKMGYHQRNDTNKLIFKIGAKPEEINPSGGFVHYGNVKNEYLVVKGSIPGPTKRIVRLVASRRINKKIPTEAPQIQHTSLVAKQ